MADMYLMPLDRYVVVNLEYIRGILEASNGTYQLLVSGQWIVFTPEEKSIVKPIVDAYFGDYELPE